MSSDDFSTLFSVEDIERQNHPMRAAQAAMRKPMPKRFYSAAAVVAEAAGFRLVLDGKGTLTPKRAPLLLPTEAAADCVASEWNAQKDVINPNTMPATRIANAAIDHVAFAMDEVRDDAVKYFGTDLICYRAGEPERLVERQRALWGPLVDWIETRLGVRLRQATGIVFEPQLDATVVAFRLALDAIADPVALAAFHVMVTLSGSAVIALATAEATITPPDAFAASELDADFQVEAWGTDDEAAARRAYRESEFIAAARLYRAVAG